MKDGSITQEGNCDVMTSMAEDERSEGAYGMKAKGGTKAGPVQGDTINQERLEKKRMLRDDERRNENNRTKYLKRMWQKPETRKDAGMARRNSSDGDKEIQDWR
eukprot:5397858-Pleurochrysis_carterae.AAC.2